MPRSPDLDRLRQVEARPSALIEATPEPIAPTAHRTEAAPERWPSREPSRDGQECIKAPLDVIERFRGICRDDRRTYADMLGISMDRYERGG